MLPRPNRPACVMHLATLDATARKMRDEDRSVLAVLRDDRLIGVISESDLVRRFLAEGQDSWLACVSEFMTRDVVTCSADDDPEHMLFAMKRAGFDSLPLVDADMRFVKMVDLADLEERPIPRLADTPPPPKKRERSMGACS